MTTESRSANVGAMLALLLLAGCSPSQSGPALGRASSVAQECAKQGGKAVIVSSAFRRTSLSVDCYLSERAQ